MEIQNVPVLPPHEVRAGLSTPDHQSSVFDMYLQSPTRYTNSLSDFLEDLLLDQALSPGQLRAITNVQAKPSGVVPFVGKEILENVASRVHQDISYLSGRVALDRVCDTERDRSGLVLKLDAEPSSDFVERQILGRITFDPPTIEIFRQASPNAGRNRFTLAHELAHHLLGHGDHMVREYCQDDDFSIESGQAPDGTDIKRMEFQANYLASSLLLPKHNVIEDFHGLVGKLG
ncbi:MAG: ImmA/IrrE family metallo-endopeptidase, partial [Nitrospiraceae bacterium]|nr:ImmA/IrrE family metallo-endopeptidase [Nitrospiraceae bacterium]